MIIDCHAHIIEHLSGMGARGEVRPVGRGMVSFLDGTKQKVIPEECGDKEYLAETLIRQMDQAGIDKAVLLHGLLYGLQNEYIFETVKKYPNRFIGSGSLDPCIEQIDMVLECLIYKFGFRILKFEISTGAGMTGIHSDLKIDGIEFETIFKKAEKEHITLVFDIGRRGMKSYQIQELCRASRKHDTVKFVVCHLLAADGECFDQWEEDMGQLAECRNIWFDITAVPWNMRERYPFPKSADLIYRAKKIVGSKRMMWGSDVPQLLVIEDYRRLYDFLLADDRFSDEERADILCNTAAEVYGIREEKD